MCWRFDNLCLLVDVLHTKLALGPDGKRQPGRVVTPVLQEMPSQLCLWGSLTGIDVGVGEPASQPAANLTIEVFGEKYKEYVIPMEVGVLSGLVEEINLPYTDNAMRLVFDLRDAAIRVYSLASSPCPFTGPRLNLCEFFFIIT